MNQIEGVKMQWLANWWNFVFHSMMGGSVLLMFMFGWEIFLIPITLAVGVAAAGIGMLVTLIQSQRNNYE